MRLLRATVAIGLAVTLAACGGGAPAGAGGDSYSVGVTSYFLAHFTPGKSGGSNIDYALFTPLTRLDTATGKVVNAVASSIETDDNRTWRIELKPGWKFHNGEDVTARSFADSWNATAYGPNAMTLGNSMFAPFKGYAELNPAKGKPKAKTLSGVKVTGPRTLEVELDRPLSLLPYVLAQSAFAPMPRAAFKDLDAFDRKPIGNGPYQVDGPGMSTGATRLGLKRFDGYPGAKGNARTIEVKSYIDETAGFRDLQAGSLDVMLVSGNNLTTAANTLKDRLVKVPFPAVIYLGFPHWDKRFDDLRVREAFSKAIDRGTIVRSLLHGNGTPATGLAGKAIPGGGQADCAACAYDPAGAKALLKEAGGWQGELTLWTDQDPVNKVVLEAISNQLRTNLGIKSVTTKTQPTDQLYPNLSAHKVDGPALLYMGAGYPHLYALADQLFTNGSANNVTGYDSADFRTRLDAAAASEDAIGGTREATRTAMGELPLAPIFQPVGGLAHSARVGNVKPEFLGGAVLSAVTVGD